MKFSLVRTFAWGTALIIYYLMLLAAGIDNNNWWFFISTGYLGVMLGLAKTHYFL